MLQPYYGDIKKRSFIVFDLEWRKGEKIGRNYYPQVSLCGVFDGNRYRHYFTIRDFLQNELTHQNRGKWFYAHAGGLADMIFVFEELLTDPSYKVEASFSGSSAIIVRVVKGKSRWTFVDSYWLLRDKLANIAKIVNMEKGDVDFEASNLFELIEYNEVDCKILWFAIAAFERTIHSLGGQLQMTLASCSMFLFRKKYLQHTIVTSDTINAASRQSYTASRVEIFERDCQAATYYDINSSFPYAMTFEAPGALLRTDRHMPEHGTMFVADVEVTVPEMYFPPLAYRHLGRVYFPTGTWRCWFTGVDIRLLESVGGKVNTVYEVMHFSPFEDLSAFARDLYERRLAAKDDTQKLVLKLLLNSLYGKFGESSTKTKLLCYPDDPPQGENIDMLMPGVFLVEEEREIAHAHVPIAAHITAKAREVLYRYMADSGTFFYCDTDGFAATRSDIATGTGLGALKREMEIVRGRFYRPKVYELEHAEGKRVKAKGFTLSPDNEVRHQWSTSERKQKEKEHTYAQFHKLVNGGEIETRRFYRIRELFRIGDRYRPTETNIIKRLQRETPKRRFTRDGKSEPWDVQDLERMG